MSANPLRELQSFGQSIWLDSLPRGLLLRGSLERLIDEDGVSGAAFNLTVLATAFVASHDYDEDIHDLAIEERSVADIYTTLTVEDAQYAADVFWPIYERTKGQDGFVSLQLPPDLAGDREDILAEARRLWTFLDRPNVMIQLSATEETVPVLQQLIAEGINVNVTPLFSLSRYRQVAEAYLAGLEARVAAGKSVAALASVASFSLGRIDALIDPLLEQQIERGGTEGEMAARLQGKVAIATARLAYQIYKELFTSERFRKLAERGARPQRLLWTRLGIHSPMFSDLMYVESLIGAQTVSVLPLATLHAYREQGEPAARLEEDVPEAQHVLQRLPEAGIDLAATTKRLEEQGTNRFRATFERLQAILEAKRTSSLLESIDRQTFSLAGSKEVVGECLDNLEREDANDRLWRKDATLWTEDEGSQTRIRQAMGWLHIAGHMEEHVDRLIAFAAQMRAAGFRRVVHMGMGGSSSAPLLFRGIFAPTPNGLPLVVLDTTDPATILHVERAAPLEETLFIVATKSGASVETMAFADYFYARLQAIKGDRAGENFVAITDPGKPLVQVARERRFRAVFLNAADIGGRHSALSYFGLVPAALLGVNLSELLIRVRRMAQACAAYVPAAESPGVVLGAALGELARAGRDKVTFLLSRSVASLGAWLEQLLAESTGVDGKGLLPIIGEPLGTSLAYGADRLFVFIRHKGRPGDDPFDLSVSGLQQTGHPVAILQMEEALDVGQELFRWEIATAIAASILGVNPFTHATIQESKQLTNELLQACADQGRLPEAKPSLVEGPLSFYTRHTVTSGKETLAHFLAQAKAGDYIALLAYLTEEPETEHTLQAIRIRLRDDLERATTVGYGPRYLHSTGQYHKAGPNTGLFLLLTADDAEDVAIPGRPYSFGVLKRAQALGDVRALEKYGRRVLRIHLGANVRQGLTALSQLVEAALATR